MTDQEKLLVLKGPPEDNKNFKKNMTRQLTARIWVYSGPEEGASHAKSTKITKN